MLRELQTIEIFKDAGRALSFTEILEISPLTRQPLFRQLQMLVEEGILSKRKIANIAIYYLNLDLAAPLCVYIDQKRFQSQLSKSTQEKINGIFSRKNYLAIIKLGKKPELIFFNEENSSIDQKEISQLSKDIKTTCLDFSKKERWLEGNIFSEENKAKFAVISSAVTFYKTQKKRYSHA